MLIKLLSALLPSPAPVVPDPLLGAAQVVRRTLGRQRSPLDIQRILYIAQMVHLGERETPIFPDLFKASMMGPIIPRLMPVLKRRYATDNRVHLNALSADATETLESVTRQLSDFSAGRLVSITHGDKSAWGKHFTISVAREPYAGVKIPLAAMVEDYHSRMAEPEAPAPIDEMAEG
jgi:uncharacterized phage-associated protein